jgi:hypothetical protein
VAAFTQFPDLLIYHPHTASEFPHIRSTPIVFPDPLVVIGVGNISALLAGTMSYPQTFKIPRRFFVILPNLAL